MCILQVIYFYRYFTSYFWDRRISRVPHFLLLIYLHGLFCQLDQSWGKTSIEWAPSSTIYTGIFDPNNIAIHVAQNAVRRIFKADGEILVVQLQSTFLMSGKTMEAVGVSRFYASVVHNDWFLSLINVVDPLTQLPNSERVEAITVKRHE